MELKLLIFLADIVCIILLIVPYGIETRTKEIQLKVQTTLLIVPYGIETISSGCISSPGIFF